MWCQVEHREEGIEGMSRYSEGKEMMEEREGQRQGSGSSDSGNAEYGMLNTPSRYRRLKEQAVNGLRVRSRMKPDIPPAAYVS